MHYPFNISFFIYKYINFREEQESAVNEVTVLASIESTFVIKYFDSFLEGSVLNIVMEYAPNGTLEDALTVWQPFLFDYITYLIS